MINENLKKIPPIGFGLDKLSAKQVDELVPIALESGFRSFDTAQMYGNEADLGLAIQKIGAARKDIFITTKVMNENFFGNKFIQSVEQSLEKLRLDKIDLLLVHWPGKLIPIERQVELLNEAHQKGYTKHIGVSNYNSKQLLKSIKESNIPIATNQVEVHPYLDQKKLRSIAHNLGVQLTGYFVMAKGRVVNELKLNEIGKKYGKDIAQIALRWVHQNGDIPLTRSTNKERIYSNFNIFDFSLSDEDMREIDTLVNPLGRIVNPIDLAPDWD